MEGGKINYSRDIGWRVEGWQRKGGLRIDRDSTKENPYQRPPGADKVNIVIAVGIIDF